MLSRVFPLLPLLLTLACDSGGETEENSARIDTIEALDGKSADGQTVFTSVCGTTVCHGADGNTPGTADTVKLGDEVPEIDDREIIDVIINGEGDMPAQTTLSDQQVADVTAYVRATFK